MRDEIARKMQEGTAMWRVVMAIMMEVMIVEREALVADREMRMIEREGMRIVRERMSVEREQITIGMKSVTGMTAHRRERETEQAQSKPPAAQERSISDRLFLLCSERAALHSHDALPAWYIPALRAVLSWKGLHLLACSLTLQPHTFKYNDHIIIAQLIRRISSLTFFPETWMVII